MRKLIPLLLLVAGSAHAREDLSWLKVSSRAPVIGSFSASPAAVPYGGSTTLSWSVSGASGLSIDQGVGAVTGSSTTVADITSAVTYTLTATSSKGKVSTAQAAITLTGPWLITDDANVQCHMWWDGSAMQKTGACSPSMVGTVPQVASSGTLGAPPYTPAGAGPFSSANYYRDTGGWDPSGAHMVAVAFVGPSGSPTADLVGDFVNGTSGWRLLLFSGAAFLDTWSPALTRQTVTAYVVGAVNVVCGGYSGTQQVSRMNLGTTQTTTVSMWPPASSTDARVGYSSSAFGGTVLEVYYTSTAASAANCAAIANQVKARSGASW
jgi:hypothetical protein